MADYSIRLAEPGEYPAVGELTRNVYVGDGLEAEDSPYNARLLDAAGRAHDAGLLVAAGTEGELLGTVTYCVYGSACAQRAEPGEAEFRMLAVVPGARGRGVGEALVRAVLDRAARDAASAVVLSTAEEMTAAHRLYERLGFLRTPERDWCPVPWARLRTYRKELPVG
ncbi:GNAT family N-acetyltransferase [Sciscionella sediminilitoris]|uniref:GNAT family N-acetyltransferase n=1 Tax=Sciscionella sediminilitoris TaxID=1445613 RepID=UPI0004DF2CAE|nr:GNAT family N-acetyltransferase [Sciscionella sp. SE31]